MDETDICITCIGAGSSHSLAVLSGRGRGSGLALSWGRGEDGQLGHGTAANQHHPKVIERLKDTDIKSVICGAEYSIAVCRDGQKVYSWGWGDFGRLGHGDSNDVFIPRLISSLTDRGVKSIACGDTHTLVVLNDGGMLSFGRGQNGQLGHGTWHDCPVPKEVTHLDGERVTSAAAGAEHSICLTASGRVYSWGWGRYGNLGTGSCSDEAIPVLMKGLDGVKIASIACGWRHSLLVGDRGTLFTCGWSKYGQLGHGDFLDLNVPAPVAALQDQPVTAISGGWRHTVAATAHALYSWGWGKFGQLGAGKDDLPTPTRVEELCGENTTVSMIACGWKHTLAVTSDGQFYAWGRGTNGQLGVEAHSDVFRPTLIETLSKGKINAASLEHGTTGNERMFVPACDRYAVVPGNEDEPIVPDVSPARATSPKRPRLDDASSERSYNGTT